MNYSWHDAQPLTEASLQYHLYENHNLLCFGLLPEERKYLIIKKQKYIKMASSSQGEPAAFDSFYKELKEVS